MANYIQKIWFKTLLKSKAMELETDRYFQPFKAIINRISGMVNILIIVPILLNFGILIINKLLNLPVIGGYKLLSLLTGARVYEAIATLEEEVGPVPLFAETDAVDFANTLKSWLFAPTVLALDLAQSTVFLESENQEFTRLYKSYVKGQLLHAGSTSEEAEQKADARMEELYKKSLRENGIRNIKLYSRAVYNTLTQPLPDGLFNKALSVPKRIGIAITGGILLALIGTVVTAQSLLSSCEKVVGNLVLLVLMTAKLPLNFPLYVLDGMRYVGSKLGISAQTSQEVEVEDEEASSENDSDTDSELPVSPPRNGTPLATLNPAVDQALLNAAGQGAGLGLPPAAAAIVSAPPVAVSDDTELFRLSETAYSFLAAHREQNPSQGLELDPNVALLLLAEDAQREYQDNVAAGPVH